MAVIDRVVNIIRNKKAIIFAGSGMSYYSNCPTGSSLAKIILETFDPEDREIFKDSKLPEISQHFVNLRNGNKTEIISLLKSQYKRHYNSIEYHKKISLIPQISNIITTNYDYLFEKAYCDRLEAIYNDYDLSLISLNKVHLYKLHGDFEHADKIILTTRDFTDFYKEIKIKIIWSQLVSLFTANSVIFIGYGLEEEHVDEIFDFVYSKLGNFQNECFFVSKTISEEKRKMLKKFKNITPIESKAEEFIKSIYASIHRHLLSDIIIRKVDDLTAKPVFEALKIIPVYTIENSKMKKIELLSPNPTKLKMNHKYGELFREISENSLNSNRCLIEVNHEDLRGEFSFSTKREKELKDFLTGESIEDFIVSSDELRKFELNIQDLQIADFKEGESKNLLIRNNPTEVHKSFLYNEISGRIDNVQFKIFKFPQIVHIVCVHDQFKIHYKIKYCKDDDEFQGNFTYEFRLKDSSLGIKLCQYLLNNDAIEFPTNNGIMRLANFTNDPNNIGFLKSMSDVFEKIHFIENVIGKTLINDESYYDISSDDILIINRLFSILHDKQIKTNSIKTKIRIINEEPIHRFIENSSSDVIFKPSVPEILDYKIFDKKIKIKIDSFELLNAKIKNLDELLKAIRKGIKEVFVIIESQDYILINNIETKVEALH
ncbi:MAG: SIR2 family protein [Candidatus Cloacimonadales bacterium]|nr:SIR2 family protein [Candidatus Cloacimonadales bacterium]